MAAGASAFKRAPRRIPAEIAESEIAGRRAVFALPMTYMNESGHPVRRLVEYFKVAAPDVAVVHDDIDLPFGKIRFHQGRGAGGHNGVSSVLRSLGRQDLWRLKFGVGRPPGRQDPADFVLKPFAKKERDDVDLMVGEAAAVLRCFAIDGGDAATQAAGDATARMGIAKGDPR